MEYPNFSFNITHENTTNKARCGLLSTPNGTIETPNFIFCATKAALKGVTLEDAKNAGAEIILSNTYHLLLNPGADLVEKNGGLHKMMQWKAPMLTDSGGFQIFSLGHGGVADEIKGKNRISTPKTLKKITEKGAIFRSYIDGSEHMLTPESSIDVQRKLGADFILVLDECTPFHVKKAYTERSMHLSHRWAIRSLNEFKRQHNGTQALYGIIQGGIYDDLRVQSAQFVASQPFFGQAIGGSLGGDKDQMRQVVSMVTEFLPKERPTHLLGIGGLKDIWNGVAAGIDTFDCVHPTRLARHGGALVIPAENDGKEHINLKNAQFKHDLSPLDLSPDFNVYSNNFTRSYIHYLFKADENLGGTLLTIHNIYFMMKMVRSIRRSIKGGYFEEERKRWLGY